MNLQIVVVGRWFSERVCWGSIGPAALQVTAQVSSSPVT
jgi:hypothetical protein